MGRDHDGNPLLALRATGVAALLVVVGAVAFAGAAFSNSARSDWPERRGPSRDGISAEIGLPESWSPDGENLLFRAPFGGRSTPVVLGDRLFVQNGVGEGATRQERLLALDAGTGAVLWEVRQNVYHSDAPPRRVGWAAPAVDAETGSVFMFTVGGQFSAFSAEDGSVRWTRSLPEEIGLISTHGGRTPSPLLFRDLVIVSSLSSSWGAHARGSQRFYAFDKRTGQMVWMSAPGGRPFDTTYAPAQIVPIGGQPLLLVGGGDGAFHALQPATGAPVWSYPMSKRGVNSAAVVIGDLAVVSHGEENNEFSTMGLLAGLDATSSGEIAWDAARWQVPGFLGGFSSGVTDGEVIYQFDNSANLHAFAAADGAELWVENFGTMQRASPVLADGKLYVGTVNGRFLILRADRSGVEILDDDVIGDGEVPDEIIASVAISDGVVYLVSSGGVYAIGERRPGPDPAPEPAPPAGGEAVRLVVWPTEEILTPGDEIALRVEAFDARGNPAELPAGITWSVDGFEGEIEPSETGATLRAGGSGAAGSVTASAGSAEGAARFRVVPPLPWRWDFDADDARLPPQWVNSTGKYQTRELETGERVLVKTADNPFLRRARVYMGPPTLSGVRVSADVMAAERRRSLGNVGLVSQRYQFVLMGNHQRLEIHSWQATPGRGTAIPFAWERDTWYSMTFEVVPEGDGVVARGKVWPRSEPEPEEWTLEWSEDLPHREGTPGIFADAVTAEIYFDNIVVEPGE